MFTGKNSKAISSVLLASEAKVKAKADSTGWISIEDLKEVIQEEAKKIAEGAEEVARLVETAAAVMLVKSTAIKHFTGPVNMCLDELQMSVKDTVFAALFAAANLNVVSELTTPQPHLDLHSRDNFLKLAETAWDCMQLHYKSLLKSTGRHPQHDN